MRINKNLPNYLTIFRLASIPLIVATFYFEESRLARILGCAIFMIAGVSDFFDGYLARRFNIVSGFGRMFDPIADKVLVGCVLVMLVKYNRAAEIPALLILAREFVVAGLREFLAQLHVSVPVDWLAKLKTAVQMLALTLLILGSKGSGVEFLDYLGGVCLWVAAALTLVTGFSYLKASYRYF